MICQSIGLPPISIIGFGLRCVSSPIRVPKPPARITTFITFPPHRGRRPHSIPSWNQPTASPPPWAARRALAASPRRLRRLDGGMARPRALAGLRLMQRLSENVRRFLVRDQEIEDIFSHAPVPLYVCVSIIDKSSV